MLGHRLLFPFAILIFPSLCLFFLLSCLQNPFIYAPKEFELDGTTMVNTMELVCAGIGWVTIVVPNACKAKIRVVRPDVGSCPPAEQIETPFYLSPLFVLDHFFF